MSTPIVVRLTRRVGRYPKDAQLGFESEAQARKVLGDEGAYRVVGHQDGSPYAPPKREPRERRGRDAEPAS